MGLETLIYALCDLCLCIYIVKTHLATVAPVTRKPVNVFLHESDCLHCLVLVRTYWFGH